MIGEIADKIIGCGGTTANTGVKGCQIEFGAPLHAIGLVRGTRIPASQVFNKEYIDGLVQKGTAVVLVGAEEYENQSSEDGFNTNSRNVERLNLLGLPKYALKFEYGHQFYKELAKLTSYRGLDWIWGDEQGNWKVAYFSDGTYGGFTCGQTLAGITMTKELGGTPEGKMLSVQMTDRLQWDTQYSILVREMLTFSPEELDGANELRINLTTPADGATTIAFTVVLEGDGTTAVEGLADADLRAIVNGVAVSITGVTEPSAGNYTGAIAALSATDTITVETFDGTENVNRILKSGVVYIGESGAETVV